MTLHSIGRENLAMLMDEKDLQEDSRSNDLNINRIKEIAESAFINNGVLPGDITLEAYTGKTGALVFAKAVRADCMLYFQFSSCDCAADAARAVSHLASLDSSFFSLNNEYFLGLSGSEPLLIKADWILREFGRREGFSRSLSARIKEYGKTLIPSDAVNVLTRFW